MSRRLIIIDTDLLALVAETARRGRRITAGKLTGQKPALKMKEVWAIRARLELNRRVRDLALFNLAIDSKLRGCDLVAPKVEDVTVAGEIKTREVIIQKKTGRPVQFEITPQTRTAVGELIAMRRLKRSDYLFPSRLGSSLTSPPGNMRGSSKAGSGQSDLIRRPTAHTL